MVDHDIDSKFEDAKLKTLDWFINEVRGIRTGRVTPDVVETIPVEHYGSRTPLNGLASISNADARTLVITPWDPGSRTSIEKALTVADLGVQPNIEGDVIRLVFPTLTEETRQQTLKIVQRKTEEARVRLRQARDEAVRLLKEEKESGDVTEDDFFDGKKKLDELIDQANDEIEALAKKKEEEVQQV